VSVYVCVCVCKAIPAVLLCDVELATLRHTN